VRAPSAGRVRPEPVAATLPFPAPSGHTVLPLQVNSIGASLGRPRTPTVQRTPKVGADAKELQPSNGNGIENSAPSGSNNGTPARTSGSSSSSTAMANSNINPAQGNGNLTTVISSALDYKRFLDRRKHMIQQQVETAQQASGPGLGDRGHRTSEANGWSSNATGPVKASHAVATTAIPNATGTSEAQVDRHNERNASSRGSRARLGSKDTGARVDSEASSGEEPATAGAATVPQQQLPGRVCVLQSRQHRGSTPTRYTQSSGTPGHGGACDSNDAGPGRSLRMSLPAGGGRQACRSLGQTQHGTREDLRAEFAADGGAAAEAGFGDGGDLKSSVDGILRDNVPVEPRSLPSSSLEDYVIGKQIGQGAYATVNFGLHKVTSKKVAVKIYDKYKLLDPQRRKSVRCEIRLMERMRHPNIVKFHEALDTSKQIYLIMDYLSGGSLHHFLKKRPGRRVDDHAARQLFFQVSQGIRYMHDRHIVHRDVKLENLLLDETGTVQIIDFGFSTIVPPGKKLKIFCGTPSYMAPEIVARKEYSGFCADVWAMGVLLYALLCGSFPFRGQNDRDLYRKIVRGVFSIPEFVGEIVRALLIRVLSTDMHRRPTIEQVLTDNWLASCRDDYTKDKVASSSSGYHPNSSTSSTGTTAAPASSAGPSSSSARDSETLVQSGVPPLMPARSSAQAQQLQLAANSATAMARAPSRAAAESEANAGALAACRGAAQFWSEATSASAAAAAAANAADASEPTAGGGVPGAACHSGSVPCEPAVPQSEDPPLVEDQSMKRVEEEAMSKLERLGYPRDEIMRQLKDESSHLCKLYHRFLKALSAWDNKK